MQQGSSSYASLCHLFQSTPAYTSTFPLIASALASPYSIDLLRLISIASKILTFKQINNVVLLAREDGITEDINSKISMSEFSKLLAMRFVRECLLSGKYHAMSLIHAKIDPLIIKIAEYQSNSIEQERGRSLFTAENTVFQNYQKDGRERTNSQFSTHQLQIIGFSLHKICLQTLSTEFQYFKYVPYHQCASIEHKFLHEHSKLNKLSEGYSRLKQKGVRFPQKMHYYHKRDVQKKQKDYIKLCRDERQIRLFYQGIFKSIDQILILRIKKIIDGAFNDKKRKKLPTIFEFIQIIFYDQELPSLKLQLQTLISLIQQSDLFILQYTSNQVSSISNSTAYLTKIMFLCVLMSSTCDLEMVELLNDSLLCIFMDKYLKIIKQHLQKAKTSENALEKTCIFYTRKFFRMVLQIYGKIVKSAQLNSYFQQKIINIPRLCQTILNIQLFGEIEEQREDTIQQISKISANFVIFHSKNQERMKYLIDLSQKQGSPSTKQIQTNIGHAHKLLQNPLAKKIQSKDIVFLYQDSEIAQIVLIQEQEKIQEFEMTKELKQENKSLFSYQINSKAYSENRSHSKRNFSQNSPFKKERDRLSFVDSLRREKQHLLSPSPKQQIYLNLSDRKKCKSNKSKTSMTMRYETASLNHEIVNEFDVQSQVTYSKKQMSHPNLDQEIKQKYIAHKKYSEVYQDVNFLKSKLGLGKQNTNAKVQSQQNGQGKNPSTANGSNHPLKFVFPLKLRKDILKSKLLLAKNNEVQVGMISHLSEQLTKIKKNLILNVNIYLTALTTLKSSQISIGNPDWLQSSIMTNNVRTEIKGDTQYICNCIFQLKIRQNSASDYNLNHFPILTISYVTESKNHGELTQNIPIFLTKFAIQKEIKDIELSILMQNTKQQCQFRINDKILKDLNDLKKHFSLIKKVKSDESVIKMQFLSPHQQYLLIFRSNKIQSQVKSQIQRKISTHTIQISKSSLFLSIRAINMNEWDESCWNILKTCYRSLFISQ